ncbi:hypothetical protein TWF694_007929 [Orbilia ellipsospora]|uniref:Uncharacterized protein n=1 Tax=Orbilia ellipsospora TaxID=2528407 RepID=A0AAV9XJL4_9PEZI
MLSMAKLKKSVGKNGIKLNSLLLKQKCHRKKLTQKKATEVLVDALDLSLGFLWMTIRCIFINAPRPPLPKYHFPYRYSELCQRDERELPPLPALNLTSMEDWCTCKKKPKKEKKKLKEEKDKLQPASIPRRSHTGPRPRPTPQPSISSPSKTSKTSKLNMTRRTAAEMAAAAGARRNVETLSDLSLCETIRPPSAYPDAQLPWEYRNHIFPTLYKYKVLVISRKILYKKNTEHSAFTSTAIPTAVAASVSTDTITNISPKEPESQSQGETQTESTDFRTIPLGKESPVTSIHDLSYEEMTAIFNMRRQAGRRNIRPISDLMPDGLPAIESAREMLNAEERDKGTRKEWRMAELFYCILEDGQLGIFLVQKDIYGARGLYEDASKAPTTSRTRSRLLDALLRPFSRNHTGSGKQTSEPKKNSSEPKKKKVSQSRRPWTQEEYEEVARNLNWIFGSGPTGPSRPGDRVV